LYLDCSSIGFPLPMTSLTTSAIALPPQCAVMARVT
jgi:hypothetical protein